jgi:hypothetical protein
VAEEEATMEMAVAKVAVAKVRYTHQETRATAQTNSPPLLRRRHLCRHGGAFSASHCSSRSGSICPMPLVLVFACCTEAYPSLYLCNSNACMSMSPAALAIHALLRVRAE